MGVNKRKQYFTQTLEEILAPMFYVTVPIILLVIWYAVLRLVMLPESAYCLHTNMKILYTQHKFEVVLGNKQHIFNILINNCILVRSH